LRQVPPATRAALDHPLLGGAVMGLAVMLLTAALIVNKRVVPE